MSTEKLYQTNTSSEPTKYTVHKSNTDYFEAGDTDVIDGSDDSFAGETDEWNDLQTINVEPPQIGFFDWLDDKLPKKKSKGFFEWLNERL